MRTTSSPIGTESEIELKRLPFHNDEYLSKSPQALAHAPDRDRLAASLTRSVGRGAMWQLTGGMLQTIIRIGASTVLARALTPVDFGLFGMAMLGREFITNIGALGMGIGIIAKAQVTDDDLCTCFWTMASARFVMFLMAFAAAPAFGLFFDEPRVTALVRLIGITFLFSILGVVPYAKLRREFKFRKAALIDLTSALFEATLACYITLNISRNYWALVTAMVVASALSNLLLFFSAGWYPKFKFKSTSFKYLFRFGIHGLGISVAEYAQQNIDYILVGRLLGPKSLGLYEFAYRTPHLFHTRLAAPLRGVVFPALSRVQDDDQMIAAGYVKTVHYVALVTFPALAGLAVLASLAVPVLWGSQWLSIVPSLRILCLCAAVRCITDSLRAVYNSKDRPDIPFKFGFVSLMFAFLAVGTLGYIYGITGVAIGMFLSTLPNLYLLILAFTLLKAPLKMMGSALWPVLASTLVVASAAHAVRMTLAYAGVPAPIVLVAAVLAGVAAYALTLLFAFPKTARGVLQTLSVVLGIPKERFPASLHL